MRLFISLKHLKRFVYISCLLFLISKTCVAQQNLFNVVTTDITDSAKLFFQEQLNVNAQTSSNATFTWGLGHGFELGFNVFGVNYDNHAHNFLKNDTDHTSPLGPILLINAQKAFELNKHFKIGIGTQSGINLTQYAKYIRPVTFSYATLVYHPFHTLKLVGGAYYGDKYFLGTGNQLGGMAGFEWAVIEHHFHLQADWLYGTNSSSVWVPGAVIYFTQNISISLGWQFPNPNSPNQQAFVFEFTFRKS